MNLESQVLIIGGGPSGLAAAVASARAGADTLLVERYGFLGGMATAGSVNPFMTFHAGGEQIIHGVMQEIVERLSERGAYGAPGSPRAFDQEAFKFVADDMIRDAGVRLLLHMTLCGALTQDDRITAARTASKWGLRDIKAEMFVDATGDADLAAFAGVPYEEGRPGDGLSQPMTLNFKMAGVDSERMPSRDEINRLWDESKASGEIHCPRENVLKFATGRPDIIHFNTTRVLHRKATDPEDLTAAEMEARDQVQEIVRWLTAKIPGFENSYLHSMGTQIGIRESRRIIGDFVLTAEDLLSARKFDDVITRGSYPIDIHNPDGSGTILKHLPPGESYDIPYRCLVPGKISNLLIAGRPISATHEAHSAIRVMPIAIGIGQAAGVAAALCVKQKTTPAELPIDLLQSKLVEQKANLGRRVEKAS